MANRQNIGNNVVTAGKFVQVGTDSLSLKQRLASISRVVSTSSFSQRLDIVQNMASDMTISPDEKQALETERQIMLKGYSSLENTAESLGLINESEFVAYRQSYESLISKLSTLLEDMSVASQVDGSFIIAYQKYLSSAEALNRLVNTVYTSSIQTSTNTRVVVSTDKTLVLDGETVRFTANIIVANGENGNTNITSQQMELREIINDEEGTNTIGEVVDTEHPYGDLFVWHFDGLAHNRQKESEFYGRQVAEISFEDMVGDISVYVESNVLMAGYKL